VRARVERSSDGLERYVQEWLTLSKLQSESRDALVCALVERLVVAERRLLAVEAGVAQLASDIEDLRRIELRPGTLLGRFCVVGIGSEIMKVEITVRGNGGESGSDRHDNSEHGQHLGVGAPLGLRTDIE